MLVSKIDLLHRGQNPLSYYLYSIMNLNTLHPCLGRQGQQTSANQGESILITHTSCCCPSSMQMLSKGEQSHQQQNQTSQATNAFDSFLETLKTLRICIYIYIYIYIIKCASFFLKIGLNLNIDY